MAKQNDNKSSNLVAHVVAIKMRKSKLTDKSSSSLSSKRVFFRMFEATNITIFTILVLILVELASCTTATADVSNSNYYSGSNENIGEYFTCSFVKS